MERDIKKEEKGIFFAFNSTSKRKGVSQRLRHSGKHGKQSSSCQPDRSQSRQRDARQSMALPLEVFGGKHCWGMWCDWAKTQNLSSTSGDLLLCFGHTNCRATSRDSPKGGHLGMILELNGTQKIHKDSMLPLEAL